MTEAQAARFLIEDLSAALSVGHQDTMSHGAPAGSRTQGPASSERASSKDHLDKKVQVLATRMMLQIFSVPSLMAYLADAAIIPTGRSDNSIKIQLDFIKLPKEILPELEKLLSTDYFKDHNLLKYIKNGQARTGLEIEVTPKDLPGDAYTYAF